MTAAPKVEWLDIVGDPDAWRAVGLTVTDDGLIPLVGTSLRVAPTNEGTAPDVESERGIAGWTLSGVGEPTEEPVEVDGLLTTIVEPQPPVFADHDLTAIGLDHVVVMTADLERTTGEVAELTGCPLKRVREVGPMRQGFHRIGPGGLIVEVVTRPELPDGPASFWGVVLNVEDLDGALERLGTDFIGSAKDAVQPGGRIATVREEAGLGLPVALMTPDPR